MKNVLFATTVLASLATVASAETGVKIGGYGRFGLVHYSDRTAPLNDTTVHTRLRLNIDAKTETDSGVVFGARLRIQDQSRGTHGSTTGGGVNAPALLYTEYEGLRVEVGNTNTAFDTAALIYGSEMGLTDKSFGDSRTSFFAFESAPYSGVSTKDRMGVFASYKFEGFQVRASFVTPDQTGALPVEEESSIAVDYKTDQFTVSAAAVQNGAGRADNDAWFIGGAYTGMENLTVGLNYFDEGINAGGVSMGSTAVLYGNYKMGATTLKGYVANNDHVNNLTDTAFGIGADYDLGGAKLTGSIQRDYNEDTWADVGVRFNF